MGIVEDVIKNKEQLFMRILEILEGKEARARVNLDGVEFHVGKSAVKLNGAVEFTFIPLEKKG